MSIEVALALGTTLVLWASAFVGIRAGLQAYTPGEVALLRYLVASAVLGVYVVVRGVPLPDRRDWPRIALTGAIGFTAYNLALNTGERTVTAGAASFVGNTAPVISAFLASLFLGDRLGAAGWLGILVSFAGAGLIGMGEGGGLRLEGGVLLVVLAATCQSTYFVLQKPLLGRMSALAFTSVALWAGTLLMLPFLPGLVRHLPDAPLAATLAVVYLGVFPAAIGYVCWAYVLTRMPVARTASFLYFVPAITTALGWVWLREVPSIVSLAGGLVAILGVGLVNTRGRPGASKPMSGEGHADALDENRPGPPPVEFALADRGRPSRASTSRGATPTRWLLDSLVHFPAALIGERRLRRTAYCRAPGTAPPLGMSVLSILVVDDYPPVREVLRIALSRHGWRVESAAGLEEAEALISGSAFDVVITDLHLGPKRAAEGYRLARHIRDRSPRTKTLLLTGGNEAEAEARENGVFLVLRKPIGLRAIASAVLELGCPAGEGEPCRE